MVNRSARPKLGCGVTSINEAAREAHAADLAALTALAAEAIAETSLRKGGDVWARREARSEPLDEGIRADLGDPDCLVVAGVIDAAVVGYAVVRAETLHDGDTLGVISDIFVTPEARGVGVGEAVVEMILAWARSRECVGVDSLALPGDRHTKNFFEAQGLVARSITVHRRLVEIEDEPVANKPEPVRSSSGKPAPGQAAAGQPAPGHSESHAA